ncbi:hypothetical protein Tco_0188814 [Tanacetum coccineum]
MNVPVPLDHFLINALTSKVFSFMVKKGKHFLGKVTPLFSSLLIKPIEDEGAQSERPSELQPTPSPTHRTESCRTRNVVSEEKETADNRVSTEDAVSTEEKVSTNKEKVSTDRSKVSTNRSRVCTDKEEVSTDRPDKGTDAQTAGRNGTQTPPTTTTASIFGDDKTIAQVLIIMSQNKEKLKEKGKGVELKDKIEEEDESDSKSEGVPEAEKKFKQLSKDEEMARKVQEEWEGEEERKRLAEKEATNDALIRNYNDIKVQEEEREQFTVEERAKFLYDTIAAQRRFLAKQRSEAIRNKPPTKNQLRNQMMTYLKHVRNFKHSDLKTKKFEEIQALYEKIKRSDEDFIAIGSTKDERMIKEMNEKGIDSSKDDSVKEEVKEEEGTKKRKSGHIKMITRKKPRPLKDVDSDEEHRRCLKIVTFEESMYSEITIEGIELFLWGDLKIMWNPQQKEMIKVISGMINKIGRLSLGDCMKLMEFSY